MTAEIHVGDVGTIFEVTVKEGTTAIDLSSATDLEFIFVKPRKVIARRTPTFSTDGTDGKLRYISLAAIPPDPDVEDDPGTPADINVAGTWQLQVFIELPTGSWHTDVTTFNVATVF